ncbi:MAG: DUF4911 domain-containing protein [Desulfobacterales bacterium]
MKPLYLPKGPSGGVGLDTIEKIFRIDRREIAYLRFIFEAYDGLAVVTTIDSQSGTVALYIPPGSEADVERIIEDLGKEMLIEPVVR